MPRRRYSLVYDEAVIVHVRAIEKRFHSVIRDTVKERLSLTPAIETRNRKPLLRPSALAPAWELRFGPQNRFRVFYRVDDERHAVRVLAIGEKRRSGLYVGGRKFDL